MKKTVFGILLLTMVLFLRYPANCEPIQPAKADARHVIARTAAIISNAQQAAIQGQKSEGLGLAVSHQILALDLYARNLYAQAVFHSMRARFLAAKVVGGVVIEALIDRVEQKYAQNGPSGKELDQKLRESKIEILNDRAAASIPLADVQ